MVAGIKKYHIKKFSRLVQELEQLRQDIQEYCPEAVYRLNTCQSLELGIDPGQFDDYPYIVAEDLLCDAINDVGTESYCVDESREHELSYRKRKKVGRTYQPAKGLTRIKIGSNRYYEEVYPYWNGYRNGFNSNLTEKEFAELHLGVELYD